MDQDVLSKRQTAREIAQRWARKPSTSSLGVQPGDPGLQYGVVQPEDLGKMQVCLDQMMMLAGS